MLRNECVFRTRLSRQFNSAQPESVRKVTDAGFVTCLICEGECVKSGLGYIVMLSVLKVSLWENNG